MTDPLAEAKRAVENALRKGFAWSPGNGLAVLANIAVEAAAPILREEWNEERRDWDQDRADWKGRAVNSEADLADLRAFVLALADELDGVLDGCYLDGLLPEQMRETALGHAPEPTT